MIFKSMTPEAYHARHLTRDTLTLREMAAVCVWLAVAGVAALVWLGVQG